jgi:predicted  nucleic acid-binding Zn-ribbon protein
MAKKTEAKEEIKEAETATRKVSSKEPKTANKKEVADRKIVETGRKGVSGKVVSTKKEKSDKYYDDEIVAETSSTRNKEIKEFTVEEKLFMLYRLQTVVSEIDKIKTLRGELPLEVQDLEDEIAGLKTRLEKFQVEILDQENNVAAQRNKISEAKLLIEKYKEQLDQVRNNREFDNLSKEIEFQELEVEFSEKKIKEFNAAIRQKKESISGFKEMLDGRKIDLELKKKELQEIVAETRQEEEKLRESAKSIEENIELRLLNAFKRIRKGARNGLAVVNIERDACGGCFNKIPPQKQLDIKLHKKIIVCEYCGRIMIDPEFTKTELN